MATLGEFGGLLQLGFGLGIGLSVFRAPLNLRAISVSKVIADDINVLKSVNTAAARAKRGKLASLWLRFDEARQKVDRAQLPFMIASLGAASLNLALLVWASVAAARPLTAWQQYALIFLSTGFYFVLVVILECIARHHLDGVAREINDLRKA